MGLIFNINVEKQGKKPKIYPCDLPQSWQEYLAQGHDGRKALEILLIQPETTAKLTILRGILKNVPKAVFFGITDVEITALVAHLNWLQPDASPMPILTEFVHEGIHYHLPKARFENGTALEFALSDDYFKKIVQAGGTEQAEKQLLALVATLCREADTNPQAAILKGDIRTPLNSRSEVENRAKQLVKLDQTVQVAVFLYFAGVKKYIADLYGTHIFAPKEEDEDETNETQNQTPAANAEPFGWWGVFMELAENPINLPKIHEMNFHTLCIWLMRQKLQADRMKQLFETPKFKNNAD